MTRSPLPCLPKVFRLRASKWTVAIMGCQARGACVRVRATIRASYYWSPRISLTQFHIAVIFKPLSGPFCAPVLKRCRVDYNHSFTAIGAKNPSTEPSLQSFSFQHLSRDLGYFKGWWMLAAICHHIFILMCGPRSRIFKVSSWELPLPMEVFTPQADSLLVVIPWMFAAVEAAPNTSN